MKAKTTENVHLGKNTSILGYKNYDSMPYRVSEETEKLQAEIKELKAEVEKIDFAYKNLEKRYNNAVTQVDELKAEVERLKGIGHTPESEMNELSTKELIERLIASQLKVEKLEFMIEHGLGYEDMVNDITMPHEI